MELYKIKYANPTESVMRCDPFDISILNDRQIDYLESDGWLNYQWDKDYDRVINIKHEANGGSAFLVVVAMVKSRLLKDNINEFLK